VNRCVWESFILHQSLDVFQFKTIIGDVGDLGTTPRCSGTKATRSCLGVPESTQYRNSMKMFTSTVPRRGAEEMDALESGVARALNRLVGSRPSRPE